MTWTSGMHCLLFYTGKWRQQQQHGLGQYYQWLAHKESPHRVIHMVQLPISTMRDRQADWVNHVFSHARTHVMSTICLLAWTTLSPCILLALSTLELGPVDLTHKNAITSIYYKVMGGNTCGTCPIAAIWLPRAANFSFVFSLVSPAGFVGSEQD